MQPVNYYPHQIVAMRPQIKELMRAISNKLCNFPNYDDLKHDEVFELDGNKFNVLFRPCPLVKLGMKRNPTAAATAAITLAGHIHTLTATEDDLGLEISEPELDAITEEFIFSTLNAMARHYYHSGPIEKVNELFEAGDTKELNLYLEQWVAGKYDEEGYLVVLMNPVDLNVLVEHKFTHKLHPHFIGNKSVCLRLIHSVAVTAVANELIWKNQWTAPIALV